MTQHVRCVSCGGTYAPEQSGGRYFHVCPPRPADADADDGATATPAPADVTIDGRPARNENRHPDWSPELRKHPTDAPPIAAEGLGVEEIADRE